MVSARALGARGRRFKSALPDHLFPVLRPPVKGAASPATGADPPSRLTAAFLSAPFMVPFLQDQTLIDEYRKRGMAIEMLKGIGSSGGYQAAQVDNPELGTHREFVVIDHGRQTICFTIQNGPPHEVGVNGCRVETMLEMVRTIYPRAGPQGLLPGEPRGPGSPGSGPGAAGQKNLRPEKPEGGGNLPGMTPILLIRGPIFGGPRQGAMDERIGRNSHHGPGTAFVKASKNRTDQAPCATG